MPLTPEQRTKLSHGLRRVARKLEKILASETGGKKLAFSLVIWGEFGEDNMIQYVANAEREACAKYMGDLLASWKQGMPDIPYHERN